MRPHGGVISGGKVIEFGDQSIALFGRRFRAKADQTVVWQLGVSIDHARRQCRAGSASGSLRRKRTGRICPAAYV
jgi:hypothetical protein